jgi:hypothetical protein
MQNSVVMHLVPHMVHSNFGSLLPGKAIFDFWASVLCFDFELC